MEVAAVAEAVLREVDGAATLEAELEAAVDSDDSSEASFLRAPSTARESFRLRPKLVMPRRDARSDSEAERSAAPVRPDERALVTTSLAHSDGKVELSHLATSSVFEAAVSDIASDSRRLASPLAGFLRVPCRSPGRPRM